MKMLPALLLILLCPAASQAAAPARALGSFAPAPGAAPPADQAPLSPEALRSCVDRQLQARREQDELAAPNAGNSQRRDDLAKRLEELEQERKVLDAKNNAAVKAFNAKAAALKTDQNALSRDVGAANSRIGAHNALIASIASDCRGRSFYQDDMDAVMKDFPGAKL